MSTLERDARFMNQTTPPAPTPDDPRYGFAHVVGRVGDLIESTVALQATTDQLSKPTPCPDFTVKELLEHCVAAVRRVGALGRGEAWSSVLDEDPVDAGWDTDYRAAAHDIMLAWQDPAQLEQTYVVPWGEFPGAALLYTYIAELAVHGWDLAQATNQPFTIDDDLLQGALIAAKFIPAEGRDDPDMPFGAVVDPGPDAPTLDQIAGWLGRAVLAS